LLALAALAASGACEASPYTVCLQPLGEHDAGLLVPISRGIAQAYGFEVRLLSPRPLPKSAWYPPRSRYRAQKLLDHLQSQVLPDAPGCDAVVGFTAADISITKGKRADWGVLGLAYRQDRVAVVSSFRMRHGTDRVQRVMRAVKVVAHELGHMLGLPHGNEGPRCLMNDAAGAVQTVDRARGTLCPGEHATAEALLGRKLPQPRTLDWRAILRKPD